MDDPLFVRRIQRVGNLARDRQDVGDRDRSTRDDVGKVFPFDQFHDQRRAAVRELLEAVDGGDVRVVERSERLRLAREACEAIGIAGEQIRQHLDRDVAIQLGVARAIHLAHAACAERTSNLVRPQAHAWREVHL